MNNPQRVIESLLLATAAGRAMLQLARPDGGFAIEAEAVQHGQPQLRHHAPEAGALDAKTLALLEQDKAIIVQDDLAQAQASGGITTRMLGPLILDGRLAGVISLHSPEPRQWSAQDKTAMADAQAKLSTILTGRASQEARSLPLTWTLSRRRESCSREPTSRAPWARPPARRS